MNIVAKHALRAAVALTGLATLGAGFAGTAVAGASVDGFDTDSMIPTDELDASFAQMLEQNAGQGVAVASPTEIASDPMPNGFVFETPFQFQASDPVSDGAESGSRAVGEHTVPALTEQPSESDPQGGAEVGQGMDGPGPLDDGSHTAPFSGMMAQVMPMLGQAAEDSNNNELGNDHDVTVD